MLRTLRSGALHVPESERRAPTRHRHTTPGSINHRIATGARDAVMAAGHPLTLAGHRETYTARYGALPAAWSARFYQLVRFGILVAVDGRTAHTRYAHRDQASLVSQFGLRASDQQEQHDHDEHHADDGAEHHHQKQQQHDERQNGAGYDDDGMIVLTALRAAVAAHGRPVSTREVAQAVAAAGFVVGDGHPNAVRQRLGSLSAVRSRGVEEWHAPRVTRLTVTTLGGRPSARWFPADVDSTNAADLMPASQTEALRAVVATACAALGRPADVAELRLWIRAHATHPASAALRSVQIGDLLPRIVKTDRARSAAGRLLQVVGDRTQGGRAPTRYIDADGVGDLEAATQRCRLLDLVRTLECATELQEIATLGHRAARLHSPSLSALAVIRRSALSCALHALAPHPRETGGGDGTTTLTDAVHRLADSMNVVADWLALIAVAARADTRTYRRMCAVAGTTARHLAAVGRDLGRAPRAMPVRRTSAVQCVSADTAVELRDLAPLLTAAAREWERPDTAATHRALTADARVFAANAPVRITGPRHGEFIARIRIDRVDALAGLYRALPVARAATLIASAQELLGRVVRDADVVGAVREASRPAMVHDADRAHVMEDHPAVWRAAVVALGLLGIAPSEQDWGIARLSAEYDRAAVILAATLASPSGAADALTRSLATGGSAGQTVAKAGRRLALGRLMTVVG